MGYSTFKIIGAIAAAVVVIAAGWFMFLRPTVALREIQVGGQSLIVEIADTDFKMQQGLSNRPNLPPSSGMLFIYPDKAVRYFWMKDMKFPLDVLWITDGAIVGLQENIPFQTSMGEVVRFHSNAPADMVLEVNAGWIAGHRVKVGDRLEFINR